MLQRPARESLWATELGGEVAAPVLPELGHQAGGTSVARSPLDPATRAFLDRHPNAAGDVGLPGSAFVVAAIAAVVARYTRVDDIAIGRRDAAGDIVVRVSLASDPSFEELASRVAAVMLRVRASARDGFDAIFAEAERTPVPVVAYAADERASLDGVHLLITRTAQSLVCRSATLSRATVDAVARHVGELLRSAATSPATPLSTLSMLDDHERREVLDRWNATDAPFPVDRTLWSLFTGVAGRHPQAPAIVDGERTTTYGELQSRASRYARAVRDRGLGPGALVGVCLDRSSELLAAIFGILAAGAAYVPLDPAYPRERLRAILDDASVSLVLSQHRHAALVAGAHETVLVDEPLPTAVAGAAARVDVPSPSDLAYVIYTSGSTGKPKGVAVEQRSVVSFVAWCANQFAPDDLAGVLFSTSICFDVSVFEVFAPLCTGGTLIVADDLLSVGTIAARDRVRIISSTTAGLAEIVRAGTLPRSVRIVMQAGEYLPRAIANEILASGVPVLYNLCGATEDTVYSTIATVDAVGGDPPIGLPFENRRAYVLDAALRPVPLGVPGELCYAGPGVAREYYRRPDLTGGRFVPNPFAHGEHDRRLYRSGDLVRRREDGQLVHLGRLDQQVKIRGFRIELAEVEAVVASHPGVFESAVIIRQNARGENELVAYVVARAEAPTFAELRAFIAARLPQYMVPAALVVLQAMPRSPSGKLDRAALPAPERLGGSGAAPSTRTEATLQTIWRDMLAVEEIGVDDNFFVMGGHSLLAARMIARAEAVFMRTGLMAPFIASPTIRTLAERIETDVAPVPLSSIVKITAPPAGTSPLFFLHGMFAGDGFYVWSVARYLPKTFGLYAVHPYGNDGTPPPETIEAMARDHLAEIRALQPHGPYRLGGFCNGGLIAYEIACQLRDQGEAVDRLVIVAANALNLRTRPLRKAIAAVGAVARLPGAVQTLAYQRSVGYAQQLRDLVYDPFTRRWRDAKHVASAAATLQRIRRERLAADGIGSGRFDRIYERAVSEFFPRRYDGKLVVVVGASSTVEGTEDATLGWSAVAGGVEVIRIPGGHHAVEEHPENFAEILAAWP